MGPLRDSTVVISDADTHGVEGQLRIVCNLTDRSRQGNDGIPRIAHCSSVPFPACGPGFLSIPCSSPTHIASMERRPVRSPLPARQIREDGTKHPDTRPRFDISMRDNMKHERAHPRRRYNRGHHKRNRIHTRRDRYRRSRRQGLPSAHTAKRSIISAPKQRD